MTDLDLSPELRRALRDEAYRAPVRLTAADLRARMASDDARRRGRRPWLSAVAALAGVAMVLAVVVFSPITRRPIGIGQTPTASAACPESPATKHGSWWFEMGGPDAFFNIEPGTRTSTADGTWLLIARFELDQGEEGPIAITAERLGSGERVEGSLNSEMDPTTIYHFDDPAPALPGGWYLFELGIHTPGCWRIDGLIGDRVAGTAMVSVPPGQSSPVDPSAPIPTTEVPSAAATSRSGQIIDCGRIGPDACANAIALVREEIHLVATAWAVVVDDDCPPTWICDRAYPFSAEVVIVPEPGSVAGSLGFSVVGANGPEQVLGVTSSLPAHVISRITAMGAASERRYDLECGPVGPPGQVSARCAERAFVAVLAAEGQYPTKVVVSLEFTGPDGDYQLFFDDNTAIGLTVN
jgi:hypothetical protein